MWIVRELKGTRFIWKIENFSLLTNGMLQSPWFSSHSARWEVRIHRTGGYDADGMDFELHQEARVEGTYNCSVAFLDLEGTPLIWRENKNCRVDRFDSIPVCAITRDEFDLMKGKLLPNETLTVECRIWQTAEDLRFESCSARTHIEPLAKVTEKTFGLAINGVTSLQTSNIKEEEFWTTSHRDMVKIRLFFNRVEEIQAEVTLPLVRTFAKCKISLLDATGKLSQFADGEFDFDSRSKKWLLSTHITKDMLRCNQDKFLLNDTLTLVFAFTFSCKVTFSRMVEENEKCFYNPQSYTHDNTMTSDQPEKSKNQESLNNFSDSESSKEQAPLNTFTEAESNEPNDNSNEPEPSNKSDPPVSKIQVLRSVYEGGLMPDFSLRVKDKTFPVNKNILGAKSPVFEAMFAADMKNKKSGFVDITDVDAETIQRMLKFVYYNTVQDFMQWDSASSLYTVAVTYAIEPLKQRCSDILKSHLCTSNVLEALLMADKGLDESLKSAALEFIAMNDKRIIGTKSWRKFEEENPLTAEDVHRMLDVKKMNG